MVSSDSGSSGRVDQRIWHCELWIPTSQPLSPCRVLQYVCTSKYVFFSSFLFLLSAY
jgi:hypothetical protein